MAKSKENSSPNSEQKIKVKTRISWKSSFKKYWQLYLLLLLPIVYFIIFKYGPMEYIITAFKKYKMNTSLWDMDWAMDKKKNTDIFFYFKQAFQDNQFLRALKNTVVLNLLDLIVGFPAPIIFALILNELVFTKFKKVVQTIAYMPHFLSWVIIYSLALRIFATDDGLLNLLINKLGGTSVPFLGEEAWWVATYVFLGVWQNFGWGSIVYLAAIAGINTELYEAASVDGAGRFSKMWHITLPGIKPTIVVLLIMNLGNILGGGFDRPFAMQNSLVLDSAEVISTYVYKKGVLAAQYSLTTAVGLFQSLVGVFFLLMANFISRKLGERGIW
jgi:putative aldouronate transport system permease protein